MRITRAALPLALGIGGLVCIVHAVGCDDDGSHTYVGRSYVEGRDCLGTASAIDAVEGPDPGTCPPACIVQKPPEGGRLIYVSTMCAPYPGGNTFDTSGKEPICAAAIAAFERDDTCLTDGGSTAPPPPSPTNDAGPTSDASSD